MVKRSKSSLAPDDREIAELFDSWDKLLEWLLNTAPSSMRMIQPALGHLLTFVRFFHANIGQDLDVSYLWGSLVCLLQVSRSQWLLLLAHADDDIWCALSSLYLSIWENWTNSHAWWNLLLSRPSHLTATACEPASSRVPSRKFASTYNINS